MSFVGVVIVEGCEAYVGLGGAEGVDVFVDIAAVVGESPVRVTGEAGWKLGFRLSWLRGRFSKLNGVEGSSGACEM